VGGQLIRCSPENNESQWDYYDNSQGCCMHSINKAKINTKSSTEAELVTIDDSMAQVLWTTHFLASQVIRVPTTTIYQDNKSTILLA